MEIDSRMAAASRAAADIRRVGLECAVNCRISVTAHLVLPDKGPPATSDEGVLAAHTGVPVVVRLSRAARANLKRHIRSARLRVQVSANQLVSGASASTTRVFRFKR